MIITCDCRLFANVLSQALKDYHVHMHDMKKDHFDSMKQHESADPELKKQKALRILEIGAGSGIGDKFNKYIKLSVLLPFNRFQL